MRLERHTIYMDASPMGKAVVGVMFDRHRLQFYIRPVLQAQSLRALMESADPRLISP